MVSGYSGTATTTGRGGLLPAPATMAATKAVISRPPTRIPTTTTTNTNTTPSSNGKEDGGPPVTVFIGIYRLLYVYLDNGFLFSIFESRHILWIIYTLIELAL